MSFANPTPLRIGMTATFDGRRYRVAGRVVMGMEEDGETYYWNEFNLVYDGDESATLVFEETESGGEWRLFTLFEPEFPMSAADAATKQVGDQLNLEGQDLRVTLVDETQVYHIEGEAPEGVEVGDVAHYFNAEAGSRMIVVSWTGEEVEYYRGVTLSAARIASAFHLREGQLSSLSRLAGGKPLSPSSARTQEGAELWSKPVVKWGFVVSVLALIMGVLAMLLSRRPLVNLTATPAPAASLAVGSAGKLGEKTFHVQDHAVVEIAQVGRRHHRHEYQLLDEMENPMLLIQGLKPGDKDWFGFAPLQPIEPLSPVQAAALRRGDLVNLDGNSARVEELFQSKVLQMEGAVTPELSPGATTFNFSAHAGSAPLLVRWNDREIKFYRGNLLAKGTVEAAFGAKSGK